MSADVLQIGAFGLEVISVSYPTSVNLLLIMNGLGLMGRLIPNYLADLKFGPLNTILPFSFVSATILFAWSGVTSTGGLYAFAAVYGLFTAGFQGLFPATLSSLTTDLSKAGVRMGMGFSIAGVAALTGPPLAGALIQAHGGSYLYAQMWGGTVMIAGGLTLIAARISKTGWVLKKRV